MTINLSPQHLLQDVLSRNPGASLAQIRRFHPAFRKMSVDQLSLRLSRVIDRASDVRGK